MQVCIDRRAVSYSRPWRAVLQFMDSVIECVMRVDDWTCRAAGVWIKAA